MFSCLTFFGLRFFSRLLKSNILVIQRGMEGGDMMGRESMRVRLENVDF